MAVTKSFKLAELIRHIEYDSTNDIISTTKGFKDKNKKKDATTKTATTLKSDVTTTITNYSTNTLSQFDGVFRYSKLTGLIDDTDNSIL